MANRNNQYLLISLMGMFALLVGIIYFSNTSDSISVDKNLFKVVDQTKIDRVLLKKHDEQVELHYNGSKWMVNNTFEADRQLIEVLFATLLQAEPRRPVAQRQLDSVNQLLRQQGTTVKLYEGEELRKDFVVSGNDRKSETYYELTGESSPYLITIPGYRVYVAAIFELTSLDWRDKRIFNFNWQNFKRLTATYKGNEKESFAISFKDAYFGLEGNSQADTTKLNDYLDAVSLIQAVRYMPQGESTAYDSMLTSPPYYSIEVTDIANRNYRLDLYSPKRGEAVVLGKMSEGPALLIRIEDFIRIDRKKSHFAR